MIASVTVNATYCWLLANRPTGVVKISFSRLSERHEGLTRIEERRILGSTLRFKLDYTAPYIGLSTDKTFFAALRDPIQRPILCPFWPAAVQWGTSLLYTCGLRVTWEEDWSKYEVHTGTAPSGFTPSANAWTAPCLWGRFGKSPDPGLDNPEILDAVISFVENGPATYAIAPIVSANLGPVVQGAAQPILDFDVADYSTASTGGVDVTFTRSMLGFSRSEAETFYPQTPRRTVKQTLVGIDATTLARLIATFHACAGAVKPLWFASLNSPTRLASTPSSGSSLLSVVDASALGGHPYILLRNFDGRNVARSIVSLAGNVLTLNATPVDMVMTDVNLQQLYLGRFLGDEQTISWTSNAYWTSQTTLIEIPPEYGTLTGEVYGTSFGAVGSPVQLIEVTDQVGGSWKWTNYEADVLVSGTTYTSQKVAWDEISTGINLDDGTCKLTTDSWVGNPFMRLTIPRRGQTLTLVLKEWDAVTGTVDYLWKGYASSTRSVGKLLESPLKGEGRSFEMKVPRRMDGPTCPWICYGPGCPVVASTKAKSGTITTQVDTLTVRVQLAAASVVHAWANGWLERTVPGVGSPTYSIIDSTVSASNAVDLILDMPLYPALSGGESVVLYPSCGNSWDTCIADTPATAFGGAPRKPASNPVFTAIKQASAGGSKK